MQIISFYWLCKRPEFDFGTAPTILTLVTKRESENWGGGAKTSSTTGGPVVSVNSGGGGTNISSLSSNSVSIGGGSCANDTAFLVRVVLCCDVRGNVWVAEGVGPSLFKPASKPVGGPTGISWSELTPLDELSPSSPPCVKKSFG